jgi:bifunctional non-homologous end joining protein LigD
MLRDRLKTYRGKRDFEQTAEPSGGQRAGAAPKAKAGKARAPRLRYLIQKHDASHLHYDFRLEHEGVLLSWACPKGPSLDPADKRLAVQVEDHPLDYGDFEGTIPKGQYGGGTVMLWDRGTWVPHGDVDAGLAEGKLKFDLHGERLTGGWTLVRLRSRKKDRGRANWLLIKEKDDVAVEGGTPLVDTETTSVKSGRRMQEIAQGRAVWDSNKRPAKKEAEKGKRQYAAKVAAEKSVAKKVAKKAAKRTTSKAPRGGRSKTASPAKKSAATSRRKSRSKKSSGKKSKQRGARPPAFIAPQLATLVDSAPPGDGWLHEIKYDGYRAITSIGGDRVVIRTRNGLDWTETFAPLVEPLSQLACQSAVLDGEITVADAQGHTSFGALQNAISEGSGDFVYYLFDLLQLDGRDLRALPLIERKDRLAALLSDGADSGPLVYSGHMTEEGDTVFAHACDLKLEGIISKRAQDSYRSGRTKSWLKTKCGMEQEFVIIGWRPSDKKGRRFSSILLAVHEKGRLRYCGRVGTGYSDTILADLATRFAALARKTPPVADVPAAIKRQARFVEPTLVAEIAFHGWTRDNMVRQGSFQGLREDKAAKTVTVERPMTTKRAIDSKKTSAEHAKGTTAKKSSAAKNSKEATPRKGKRSGGSEADEAAGIAITHPDRMLFEKQGITKRALVDYYLAVAPLMLPHVAGRPLSLVRCPRGSGKDCFFQKHASPGWPDAFKAVSIREKSGTDKYLYIDDESGLVAATQMGALELHIWGAHADRVEKPDRMVFDLDPDEDLAFADVKAAALDLRDRLAAHGLKSFPMATGGKGIHVVVPLVPDHSWDDHRAFAEAFARLVAEEEPTRYIAVMSKAKRKGKIFIDYLRNQRGATAIAPYSSRSRAGATVAWPVSWGELARLENAHPVTIAEAPAKLKRQKDPWPGYATLRQKLPRL